MKKISFVLIMFLVGKVFADCGIPGWPGCSDRDFQNAMELRNQRNLQNYQLNIQEQQLQEMQRANRLTQQLIEQQRRQNLHNSIFQDAVIVPPDFYQQIQQQRCLTMPLGTRGC